MILGIYIKIQTVYHMFTWSRVCISLHMSAKPKLLQADAKTTQWSSGYAGILLYGFVHIFPHAMHAHLVASFESSSPSCLFIYHHLSTIISLSIYLSICLSVCLSIHLSIYLPVITYLPFYISTYWSATCGKLIQGSLTPRPPMDFIEGPSACNL